ARRGEASALAESVGLSGALSARKSASLQHVLTHRVLDVRLFVMRDAVGPNSGALKPVDLDQLDRLGTSTLTRKLLAHIG
ncbi:MAG TPA: hypothetical protein VFZ61_03960, partial [Polyangiales bacterium]